PHRPDDLGHCGPASRVVAFQAVGNHAATDVFWLSTVAIFCQPSTLRNLICPLATRLKSRTTAESSVGSELCVFTRRRNSSWSRSIVLVVRSVFHCSFGNRKNVRSSSPPSRRLVTTPEQRLPRCARRACRQCEPPQHWPRRRFDGSRRGSRQARVCALCAVGRRAC